MPNPNETEAAVDLILEHFPEKVVPVVFTERLQGIFEGVLTNPILAGILWESDTVLKDKIIKLAYAKKMLSSEVYEAIGEANITAEGMSLDKICTIAVGDPLTTNLLDGGLSLDLIKALWGENLAHPAMIVDKITLLQYEATPKWVQETWAQKIAEMSEDELNESLYG